jgi:hypothetical protein
MISGFEAAMLIFLGIMGFLCLGVASDWKNVKWMRCLNLTLGVICWLSGVYWGITWFSEAWAAK